MKNYKKRSDVPDKYKWDLSIYYKDNKNFDEDYNICDKLIDRFSSYNGKLNNKDELYNYLELIEKAGTILDNLYVYSMLLDDVELGIKENAIRKNRVINLINKYEVNSAFFIPELLKIDEEDYIKLFDNSNLVQYKFYLDEIYRNKKHYLSENEEKIISLLVNSTNEFSDISKEMLDSLHKYGNIKLPSGEIKEIATNNYRVLTKNKDESVRKKVYTLFNKKGDEYSSVNAMLLNNYVKLQCTLSKIRNFDSSWNQKLFDLNLSNKVYESLINVTESSVGVLQKYFKLKKKVLDLPVLHHYDLNLEMGKSDKKYSIEEAKELLLNALSPLGEDYISHYKKIFDDKHIDYCQYKGKTSGAYSASTRTRDPRILMSFNEDLVSVSTIAHEGGHDVHEQYVHENNPVIYRNVPVLVSEVASLTNECLLSNYLVTNSNNVDEKLAGLENIIGVIASNLFGAVREAKIEQDMYQEVESGGVITKEFLDDLSCNSLKKYYGNTVKLDKYSKNNWIHRSHYYYFFYLYSYAISISVACNVSSKILNGDKEMLSNYINFLKTGSDTWPYDAFKILGIDLESEDTYINAIKYFESLIDEYEKIYYEEVKNG